MSCRDSNFLTDSVASSPLFVSIVGPGAISFGGDLVVRRA